MPRLFAHDYLLSVLNESWLRDSLSLRNSSGLDQDAYRALFRSIERLPDDLAARAASHILRAFPSDDCASALDVLDAVQNADRLPPASQDIWLQPIQEPYSDRLLVRLFVAYSRYGDEFVRRGLPGFEAVRAVIASSDIDTVKAALCEVPIRADRGVACVESTAAAVHTLLAPARPPLGLAAPPGDDTSSALAGAFQLRHAGTESVAAPAVPAAPSPKPPQRRASDDTEAMSPISALPSRVDTSSNPLAAGTESLPAPKPPERPLYHFTDPQNLPAIRRHGLLSWKQLRERGITHKPASNDLSRDLDFRRNLEDYVHLSLNLDHPMAHVALHENRIQDIVWLRVDPSVIHRQTTLFSNTNATAHAARIGPDWRLAFEAGDDQAEVLVYQCIEPSLITFPDSLDHS